MSFTRETIATVRRNAGKVPAAQIASDLGLSLSFLERLAREQSIDLRIHPRTDDPPEFPITDRPRRLPTANPNARTEYITSSYTRADVALMEQLAAAYNLKRSKVLTRLFENARARGMLEELVKWPAPRVGAGESVNGG